MDDWKGERSGRIREFFGLNSDAELLNSDVHAPELSDELIEGLSCFNIEWHIVPSAEALPLDDRYFTRLYSHAPRDFARGREHKASYRDLLVKGHGLHQGRVVGVDTTQKPRYLPENRQFYGTAYGHDPSADPFAVYLGRAAMVNGTRYAHNFLSLREFMRVVNEDWRARRLMPQGYRATVCPPVIFNLVGSVFHPEWSETETLELGFYRDDAGNATCYAVGSCGTGDFSFIAEVEGEDEWARAGFRLALVPE